MGWRERIERDPHALHGRLRIRGTEVPVSAVLDNLAAHMNVREVLESYPCLSEDDVRACVAWAAQCVHAAEAEADASAGSTAPAGGGAGAEAPPRARRTAWQALLEDDAFEQPAPGAPEQTTGFKEFLRSMPDVGEDADFERPLDYGRPEIEWDS